MANMTFRTMLTLPPWALAQKAVRKVRQTHQRSAQREKDKRQSSYGEENRSTSDELRQCLLPLPWDLVAPYEEQVRSLSAFFMDHRFDLLGSGWIQVQHGMTCKGIEGHVYAGNPLRVDAQGDWLQLEIDAVNLPASKRYWQILYTLNPSYRPIDWHRDFKSGYRWNPKTWSPDVVYENIPGADIKVPWELARMQHGVQLAWAYAFSGQKRPGYLPREAYLLEFQCEVLDFIATNPPRFGVNWACTMDVAIRAANWLLTYDLFRAYGAAFDSGFMHSFARSIHQHALHVRNNLEWDPHFRGNHYLANLLGMLAAAAYLPATSETSAWAHFAARELKKETRLQFHPEGTNKENSTSYHRLSAELCVYGTALAQRQGIEFPEDHFEQLAAMVQFTKDITKPDGHIPQIGDNDNGRLFKFFPVGDRNAAGEWVEDYLDHRRSPAEIRLIDQLSGHPHKPITAHKTASAPANQAWDGLKASLLSAPSSCRKRHRFTATGVNLLYDLRIHPYPQFGLYIFRSQHLYLAVRCGPYAQREAVHAHNDQLSVELQIDGRDIHRDPGSFIYTPLPDLRNRYRSVRAHFAPQGDREPGSLDKGLFVIEEAAPGTCLYWGEKGFVGMHQGFGSAVTRLVELTPNGIDILDVYEDERVARAAQTLEALPFSPGYGLRENAG